MLSPDLNAAHVHRILDSLGIAPHRLTFVAKASTSEVWRADSADGPLAVRLLAPRPGKPDDFSGDVALRRLLAARGLPVARPVTWHAERPDLPAAPRWAVDAWIAGEPVGALTTARTWYELGKLLTALHALPITGHGRLSVTAGGLSGRRESHAAGVCDRYDEAWPFHAGELDEHPIAAASPELASRLARLEQAIRKAASGGVAVTHADLNGANLREADGCLQGLIDFADATVMAPAWDFASLRHFHGDDAVHETLRGYTADSRVADAVTHDALLLSLVVALHHLSRAHTLGLPARRTYALDRLRQGLDAVALD